MSLPRMLAVLAFGVVVAGDDGGAGAPPRPHRSAAHYVFAVPLLLAAALALAVAAAYVVLRFRYGHSPRQVFHRLRALALRVTRMGPYRGYAELGGDAQQPSGDRAPSPAREQPLEATSRNPFVPRASEDALDGYGLELEFYNAAEAAEPEAEGSLAR